ncbi:Non-specific lipid-transfer protein-like protein [Dinothrombium tinctorium]|uniref:propanoyl-CoA C-acyltransferase n=1 Tax=Dinothrombium tinctorium TaxID=1965070 RepID=A0A3S3NBY8_9ACAR|nr:Non-specific lipid-transfer protein-like protein [Dinothrombium tinctorium]RWR99711.1 Non-specific lipid-transfer protein-like protein [Dinothrombium tinctorium]RWR99712.1 Non-specific lipid-transfer protein-like protein [Dinothrombium tinctorium]
MAQKVYVIGVGMTKFMEPGLLTMDYPDMVKEAVNKALADARIAYAEIEHATVGFVFGESTSGQKALYEVGMTGIPIANVNNNCATGSSALHFAKCLVAGGTYDCVLAAGFEKMERGSLNPKYRDRINPVQKHIDLLFELYGVAPVSFTAQLFAAAGKEHMEKYGTKIDHFAKIAVKNHQHSKNNPYAQIQEEYTFDEVLSSQVIFEFLTRHQCCPTSSGAAAAILASEEFVQRHSLKDRAIEILAIEMATDKPSSFEEKSAIKLVGFDMTKNAAKKAYRVAGIRPEQIDVIELHDCFSTNELITYEALGLCDVGEGKNLVDMGNNTYGGKYVINPSGGLLSKGHPLGATGIAQCAELCWQLRNEAGKRQVPKANLALQHNIGLGGAAVVAIYGSIPRDVELTSKL